jgi:hypothetical protein
MCVMQMSGGLLSINPHNQTCRATRVVSMRGSTGESWREVLLITRHGKKPVWVSAIIVNVCRNSHTRSKLPIRDNSDTLTANSHLFVHPSWRITGRPRGKQRHAEFRPHIHAEGCCHRQKRSSSPIHWWGRGVVRIAGYPSHISRYIAHRHVHVGWSLSHVSRTARVHVWVLVMGSCCVRNVPHACHVGIVCHSLLVLRRHASLMLH